MAKGVEFTDGRVFEAETRRMPNFALHELAHAYYDRILGFENAEIEAAFQKPKRWARYDQVLPYTIGKWTKTPATEVTFTQGKNTLRFTRPAENRSLSIKEFTLTPTF